MFYTGKLYGLTGMYLHVGFRLKSSFIPPVGAVPLLSDQIESLFGEKQGFRELSEVVPIYSDAVYHTGVVMQSIKILSLCILCLQASSCRTSASSQPKCKGKERQMLMLQCPSDVLKLLRRHINSWEKTTQIFDYHFESFLLTEIIGHCLLGVHHCN